MKVIVCGSRSAWGNKEARETLINELDNLWNKDQNLTIIHGACPSSPDVWGKAYASCLEAVYEEPHPADWSKGKAAGMFRNIEMAQAGADLCIAVWDGVSKGTEHMINAAVVHGIPVKIIPVDVPGKPR